MLARMVLHLVAFFRQFLDLRRVKTFAKIACRGKNVTKCPYEKGGGEIYMSNTKTDVLFVMGILIIDNKYSCNPADLKKNKVEPNAKEANS